MEWINCDPSKKVDFFTDAQRRTIEFAICAIFYAEMLVRKMGVEDKFEPYGHYFSDDEVKEINLHIKKGNFPSGYYDLCDMIGKDYLP